MQQEAIWSRARGDLVITTDKGTEDLFLWEHSVRVARNAAWITGLSEIQASSPDADAIVAAALYHAVGWVIRVKEGDVPRGEVLLRPMARAHHEQGAVFMERRLADLLSPTSLRLASQVVRTLHLREHNTLEAQIVAEAHSLDEFGPVALWTSIRRGAIEGKGVQVVIDTWRRRKEYQFWDARLRDSFTLAPVRDAARQRLERLERLMIEVEQQQLGSDLPEGVSSPAVDRLPNPSRR